MDISAWLLDTVAIPEAERAALALNRINDKPLIIVLRTAAGVNRAAQVLRVESDNSATPAESSAGATPKRKVIVFGIKGHATVADSIMAEGDRFIYAGDQYRIVDLILTLGEIQGIAEVSG